MIGGRSRKARHLHFAPQPKRRRPLRIALAAILLVALLAVAGFVKAAVASTPNLTVKRLLPASVVLPGPAPHPDWPTEGQAAVEVQGLPPLGSSGPSTPTPIASLAKIMTAYVMLRDHPLAPGRTGFTLTVSAADVSDYHQRLARSESVVPVDAGEQLDEVQLLQGLLVASGNNFATLIAHNDAGSVPAFVARMQAMAAGLGMTRTTYTDPSGLAASTVSTASDQLLLATRAMADPVFAQTVAMTSTDLPVAGLIANFNTAVGHHGYVGIKTGSDSSAGGCLVFADRQTTGGRTFTILGAVLGQSPGLHSTSTLIAAAVGAADKLVASVAAAVRVETPVPPGTVVASVTNAQGRQALVTTDGSLTVMGFGGMAVPLSVVFQPVGRELPRGVVVAHVSIAATGVPPSGADTTSARTSAAVPAASLGWKLRHDY